MASFPPPGPSESTELQFATSNPTSGSSHRRSGAIAVLTSGLLIGGVVVGSQFASADTPSLGTEPVPTVDVVDPSATEPVDAPSDEDESPDDFDFPGFDADWDAYSACFDEIVGFDFENPPGSDFDDADMEALEDNFDLADSTCSELLPAEILEEFAAFEEYDECINEQVGDDGGLIFGDEEFPEYLGSVIIDIPSGDDVDWSNYDFGAGDGSITITKTGDTISVATDGDVTKFDDSAFEAQFEELDAEWEAAEAACNSLLPEGFDFIDDIDFDIDIDFDFDFDHEDDQDDDPARDD